MQVGLAGDGPAAEAITAAFSDVDVPVIEVDADELDGVELGVVIASAGAPAFDAANDAAERWFAVEVGGLGGHALTDVDAAVSAFGAGSGCYDCLRSRVAASVGEGVRAERPEGVRSAVRFAGAVAGRRAIQWLSGEDRGGTVVEVPGEERSFLPVPGCGCGDDPDPTLPLEHEAVDLQESLARAERAVDDRLGPVEQVGERESFPVPYYIARLADTSGYSHVRAAEFAAGVDPDWDRALMKALGESLERYSAGVYRRERDWQAPAADLDSAVPPERFVRPEGYPTPDPDERIDWVSGVELGEGRVAHLPAEFVHYPPVEARYAPAITTGLGLGNSGVEAVLSGLYETVERDAAMLAWYSSFEPLGLTVDDGEFERLERRARGEDLSVTPLLVTQDVDIPVVAVAVHREGEWPRFAVGSAADLDGTAAARGALGEALQNWMELRSMGPQAAAEEKGRIGEYADFPPAAREFVDPETAVDAADVSTEVEGTAELEAVLDRVGDADLSAYAARITPRDVAALGFEATRVLVPAAQPLFTGEPFFGERARSVPRSMGFEPRLDREYHPYP